MVRCKQDIAQGQHQALLGLASLKFSQLAFYLGAACGGRALACPRCLLPGDRRCLRGTLSVLPREFRVLSSGSRRIFSDGGGLSRYRPNREHTGCEKARGDTYEDISATHRKLLLRFFYC
jgi:hypothetical protein